jgi:hypothetical protein
MTADPKTEEGLENGEFQSHSKTEIEVHAQLQPNENKPKIKEIRF